VDRLTTEPLTGSHRWVPAVGGVLIVDGRIVLIRRGNPPARGRWSLPGGRVENGESPAAAIVREMAEETGLPVRVVRLLAVVDIPTSVPRRPGDPVRSPAGGAAGEPLDVCGYRVSEYLLETDAPTVMLRAGSDASDIGWFTPAEASAADLTDGLAEHLRSWGVWGGDLSPGGSGPPTAAAQPPDPCSR